MPANTERKARGNGKEENRGAVITTLKTDGGEWEGNRESGKAVQAAQRVPSAPDERPGYVIDVLIT